MAEFSDPNAAVGAAAPTIEPVIWDATTEIDGLIAITQNGLFEYGNVYRIIFAQQQQTTVDLRLVTSGGGYLTGWVYTTSTFDHELPTTPSGLGNINTHTLQFCTYAETILHINGGGWHLSSNTIRPYNDNQQRRSRTGSSGSGLPDGLRFSFSNATAGRRILVTKVTP